MVKNNDLKKVSTEDIVEELQSRYNNALIILGDGENDQSLELIDKDSVKVAVDETSAVVGVKGDIDSCNFQAWLTGVMLKMFIDAMGGEKAGFEEARDFFFSAAHSILSGEFLQAINNRFDRYKKNGCSDELADEAIKRNITLFNSGSKIFTNITCNWAQLASLDPDLLFFLPIVSKKAQMQYIEHYVNKEGNRKSALDSEEDIRSEAMTELAEWGNIDEVAQRLKASLEKKAFKFTLVRESEDEDEEEEE